MGAGFVGADSLAGELQMDVVERVGDVFAGDVFDMGLGGREDDVWVPALAMPDAMVRFAISQGGWRGGGANSPRVPGTREM